MPSIKDRPLPTKGTLIQRGSEPKPWSYTDAANNELMQSKGLAHSSSAFPMPWPRCTNKKHTCVSLLSASIGRFKHCMCLAKCGMTTCRNLSNREMSYLHCKAHVIIFFPRFFFLNKVAYNLGCPWIYCVSEYVWPSASISHVWNYGCSNTPMKSSCAKACGGQLTYNGSHHHSFSAVDFSSLTYSGRENSQWASFAFLNCPRYTAWWAGTAEMNLIFPHYKLAFFSLTKIKLTLRRAFDKMWIPLKRTISNPRLKSNTSGYVNKRPCDKMICNTPGTSCGGHNLILTLEDLVLPHCHSALVHAPRPSPPHAHTQSLQQTLEGPTT